MDKLDAGCESMDVDADVRVEVAVKTTPVLQLVAELMLEAAKEDRQDRQATLLERLQLQMPSLMDLPQEPMDDQANALATDAAVKLWNCALSLKTKRAIPDLMHAKMRHMSFLLISYLASTEENEEILRRMLHMGVKTAEAWIQAEDFLHAMTVATMTKESYDKLSKMYNKALSGAQESSEKESTMLAVARLAFKLHCGLAISTNSLGKYDEAFAALKTAKSLLDVYPERRAYLSMLCYNQAVTAKRQGSKDRCGLWLKESFHLGEETNQGHHLQARTLRFLAQSYLEWQPNKWASHALQALDLALKYVYNVEGLMLKLHVFLETKAESTAARQVLKALFKHEDTSTEVGVNIIALLRKYKRLDLPGDGLLEQVMRLQETTGNWKLQVAYLEAVLDTDIKQALHFSETLVAGPKTGTSVDQQTRKKLHAVFWEQGNVAMESEDYETSLSWYNCALSLDAASQYSRHDLAKLHRNRANCLVCLKRLQQAQEALDEARVLDEESPIHLYLQFKISLALGDFRAATAAMKSLVSGDSDPSKCDIIRLAAKAALEEGHNETHALAVVALEGLLRYNPGEQVTLVVLQCLIKLATASFLGKNAEEQFNDLMTKKLLEQEQQQQNQHQQRQQQAQNKGSDCMLSPEKIAERAKILGYLKSASSTLLLVRERGDDLQLYKDDTVWLMTMAWNFAFLCYDDYEEMKKYFNLCFQYCELCPVKPWVGARHRESLMIAAAVCLQQALDSKQPEERKRYYEEVLEVVWNYEMTRNRYKHAVPNAEQDHTEGSTTVGQEGEGTQTEARPWLDDDNPGLLTLLSASGVEGSREQRAEAQMMLYKFEALVHLGSERAKAVLEQLLAWPALTTTTCRVLGAIASAGGQPHLAVRALKVALRLAMDQANLDIPAVSQLIHSLVQLIVSTSSTHPDAEKESLMTFNELVSIVEAKSTVYPELEIVWLMAKAWNKGVSHYSCQRLELAESWCALAMRVLPLLASTKDCYQEKMSSIYGKILSDLEAATPRMPDA